MSVLKGDRHEIADLPLLMVILLTNHAAAPRYVGIELVRSDPQDPGTLFTALAWLEGSFLGGAVIAVAVVTVTMICFMALTGRVNRKLGATVVLGCFILFGSAAIVIGAQSLAVMAR